MKRLIIASMIALIGLAGPIATQLRADDAHHPEKAGKAKKATKTKTKPQKRKAEKTSESKQGEVPFGAKAQEV